MFNVPVQSRKRLNQGLKSKIDMPTHQITISIPADILEFIESYRSQNKLQSRSGVILAALKLLQLEALEVAYSEANHELNPDFDGTIADGI